MADTGDSKFNIHMLLSLFWIIYSVHADSTEVCTSHFFEARCPANEVIVMKSAVYGRMKQGQCIVTDHEIGCKNDALADLDTHCSGKNSCRLIVSNDLWTESATSCGRHLVGYAELTYECKEMLLIESHHCHGEVVKLSSEKSTISSQNIRRLCGATVRVNVAVDKGQILNISLLNFNHQTHGTLGTVEDKTSHNSAELSAGPRRRHVMNSVGNAIEINLQHLKRDEENFILEFYVLGCSDMSPPDGAWMVRDGDMIEIGCHAGSKSWSLRCEENHWVGVLGYCGTEERENGVVKEEETVAGVWSVSLNVLVFGVCSLIILLSACIFLAGVIILKRKLTQRRLEEAHTMPLVGQTPPKYDWNQGTVSKTPAITNPLDSSVCGDYKSLAAQRATNEKPNPRRVAADYSQYINSVQSDQSGDSVKYYVLEDATQEPTHA